MSPLLLSSVGKRRQVPMTDGQTNEASCCLTWHLCYACRNSVISRRRERGNWGRKHQSPATSSAPLILHGSIQISEERSGPTCSGSFVLTHCDTLDPCCILLICVKHAPLQSMRWNIKNLTVGSVAFDGWWEAFFSCCVYFYTSIHSWESALTSIINSIDKVVQTTRNLLSPSSEGWKSEVKGSLQSDVGERLPAEFSLHKPSSWGGTEQSFLQGH